LAGGEALGGVQLRGRDGLVEVVVVQAFEQVFADEAARVQVADVEVGELRAQLVAQVVLCVVDHLTDLAQQLARSTGELRQPVGAEDQYGDDRDHDELERPYAEHVPTSPNTVKGTADSVARTWSNCPPGQPVCWPSVTTTWRGLPPRS
jgi:hypothetical protein